MGCKWKNEAQLGKMQARMFGKRRPNHSAFYGEKRPSLTWVIWREQSRGGEGGLGPVRCVCHLPNLARGTQKSRVTQKVRERGESH